MWNPKSMVVGGAVLAALFLGLCADVQAQSPYGLAARQTIPFVIQETEQAPGGEITVRSTEINVHNPGSQTITVTLTYFGAIGTATQGQVTCNKQPVTVAASATAEFSLGAVCSLNFGLNYGRLELSTLAPGGQDDPAAGVFLTVARVSGQGAYFTVEGFPQGALSANRDFADVSGLKSGQVGGFQWRTDCYAAALNEKVLALVQLVDGNGVKLGNSFAGTALDPSLGLEMQLFQDVFTLVGAPPGNYSNVSAFFSTGQLQGGQGGPGVFGFCRIVNLTQAQEAFEVAKYRANNDEGREHRTVVSDTAYGEPLFVISEVHPNQLLRESNLHVAYFQHPDRVSCMVRETSSPFAFFDTLQFRLLDPDHQVVATVVNPGGVITVDLGEKSQRHNGRNGRWLVEVAPRRTHIGCLGNCNGGLLVTGYELICSSGNGHNQLDVTGHCLMNCPKDPQTKKYSLCNLDVPFVPKRCSTYSPVP